MASYQLIFASAIESSPIEAYSKVTSDSRYADGVKPEDKKPKHKFKPTFC